MPKALHTELHARIIQNDTLQMLAGKVLEAAASIH
jgi:hypothetical protein